MTNRPLTLPLVSTGTSESAPCTDRWLSRRASLARPLGGAVHELPSREGCESEHVCELTVETRMLLRSPVRATAPHPERLPSYRAATTYAVGGCSVRIRPRKQTSRTRSPRHPPATASTAQPGSFVARGLNHRRLATANRRAQRCVRPTDAKHTTSTSTHDSFGDRSHRACARGHRCAARFHGAPHASAICSRSLQEVFSPAAVALEQPTSDASVTDFPRPIALSRARAACAFALGRSTLYAHNPPEKPAKIAFGALS